MFAVPAAAGSLLGAIANAEVSARLLVLAFVPVMLVAAGATWQRAGAERSEEDDRCPPLSPARTAAAGFAVGALTGFFGVGGGFMIVPVLTLWLGMGFRRAVATSLVIITISGSAALVSHLLAGAEPSWDVTAALAGGTAAGSAGRQHRRSSRPAGRPRARVRHRRHPRRAVPVGRRARAGWAADGVSRAAACRFNGGH